MIPRRLVLYDGECGFCHGSVRWIVDHDSEGAIAFAPLAGPTAEAILARHPEVPADLDSIVFIERDGDDERASWHSKAAFAIARHLDPPWRWLAGLGVLPSFLTDAGYKMVAAARYRIWGRVDACVLPAPEARARFLD
jgi:predicted DCC family thiol-disulfide oxidoreductase YuxK